MPVSAYTASRRDFMRWSLALGAAVVMPRRSIAFAPPPGVDHLALLSDVHVSGGFFSSMAKRLSLAVEQVLALPQRPQQVLVAGDCAHLRGTDGDYQEYARRIQPLIAAGLPMHMTIGNHDDRDRFWEALPLEQKSANQKLRRQSSVVSTQRANWFLLDSLNKTNSSPGELGRDQLEWLSAELDARAYKPAVVMLHHDPVRDGKPGSLTDAEQLLAITRPRRHVKALVFGHTHVWNVAQDQSGLHLVNLPATGYTLHMRSFVGWIGCQVYSDGALLKVHTLNPKARENGQIARLEWRAA